MNILKLIQYFKFTFIITILLSQSCTFNPKDNYLNDFNAFITEVEKEYTNYTSADWELKDAEFKEYTETKFDEYRSNLTDEDKKMIGKLVGRYSVVRAKGYEKQLKDVLNDTEKYIEGFLEGLNDDNNNNNNQ